MLISDEGKCFPWTKARRVVMNIPVTAHKMATAQNNIGPEWFMKREWQLAKIQYNPIFKSVRKRSKRNRIVTMKCKQLSLKLQGDFTGFRLGFKREWMKKKKQTNTRYGSNRKLLLDFENRCSTFIFKRILLTKGTKSTVSQKEHL